MPNSYNRIWLHVVFSTKHRQLLIHSSVESQIYWHMSEELVRMGCRVAAVNGMPDHIHLLFLLNPKMAVTDIVKHIKGESSHWINQQKLIPEKFAWQTGFAAFSVSDRHVDKVVHYIKNQKTHHSSITFEKEYEVLELEHQSAV